MTADGARSLLNFYQAHAKEPGAVVVTDSEQYGITWKHTTHPEDRPSAHTCQLQTYEPYYSAGTNNPELLARLVNDALNETESDEDEAAAIAEDNERDARDWSAFCAQVATRKAAEAADVREQSDMDE
jgi:hypothetical protein